MKYVLRFVRQQVINGAFTSLFVGRDLERDMPVAVQKDDPRVLTFESTEKAIEQIDYLWGSKACIAGGREMFYECGPVEIDPLETPEKVYAPPPVKGYRQLSQSEVDLMNRVKAKGDEIGALVDELLAMKGLDHRWVNIAKTDLQKGIMALVRAIAQPTNF